LRPVQDFYGAKGHIDVEPGAGQLERWPAIANTEQGTMDPALQKWRKARSPTWRKLKSGETVKPRDKVIRRELTISPARSSTWSAVKRSKARLEDLQFFEKVDARADEIDPPIPAAKISSSASKKRTPAISSLGAGFSSVDSIVGFVELTQGNFDLFHAPTFTGGGQKFRLRVQVGTQRRTMSMSFIEPWFLDRKLALGVELYYRDLNFQSLGNIYSELRYGTPAQPDPRAVE